MTIRRKAAWGVAVGTALLLGTAVLSAQQQLPANICDALQTERAKYPPNLTGMCESPGAASCPLGGILNAVAWQFRDDGWGVNKKDFGNWCASKAGSIACDVLHHKGSDSLFDVFGNAGAESNVNCGRGEPINHAADPDYWKRRPWVAPVDPGNTPPPPPPNNCDWPDQRAEVARLQGEVVSKDRYIAQLQADIEGLRNRVTELETERQRVLDMANSIRDQITIQFKTEPSVEVKAQLLLLNIPWVVGPQTTGRCVFDWRRFSCRLVQ